MISPLNSERGSIENLLPAKGGVFIFILKYVSSMHEIYNYKTYVSSMQQNLFILKGAWN